MAVLEMPTPDPRMLDDEVRPFAEAVGERYAIKRAIGSGGMGVVYLARDLKLDRPVALKVLPQSHDNDATARERFLREARTAARLAHPNVVPIYRADEIGGIAFFAMAVVVGESLGERVAERGPLPPADAVRVLREVAWALAYAHARGIVHRDVKPENILIERATGRAMVTDFGIARLDDAASQGAQQLTQDGHILGTLHYMSPEQVNGGTLDGRSDLYSLGIVAYQVLSGKVPFADLRGPAIFVAHATREPQPLHSVAPQVPAALSAVIDKCLRKNPDDRFQTGEAFADALTGALDSISADHDAPTGLPPGLPAQISEAQAGAIWQRAAQLQADALRRLETKRDLLPAAATSSSNDMETMSSYKLADVAAAAEEAGISRQYVAMALAEIPRDAQLPSGDARMGVTERQATAYLGTVERSLGVSHIVPASPGHTLRALGMVLQRPPYNLQLRETVGAHPLDGGVIVFDMPMLGMATDPSTGQVSMNSPWLQTNYALKVPQVQVTLRAVAGEVDRTEVTMTCDLRHGVRSNVRWSKGIASVMAVLGGAGSGGLAAVLAAQASVALGAAIAAPIAVGAVAMGGASIAWYRWLYPGSLRKARAEMLRSLQAVSASVKSEKVFGELSRESL